MDRDYFYKNRQQTNGNTIQTDDFFQMTKYHTKGEDNINEGSVEIIKDKLYFVSSDTAPLSNEDSYYFKTDDLVELEYEPFNKDFGPLKLSMVHRYCWELVRLLQDKEYHTNKIYHYCSETYDKQANGACLMGWFMIIILRKTADEAWYALKPYHKRLVWYRDSSSGPDSYKLSIYDILAGLERAISLKWYDFKTFDVHEYEYYEKVENGDLNWIIPDKFIALMGPSGKSFDRSGNEQHTPEDYEPLFKALNVERIIRLNKPCYNK